MSLIERAVQKLGDEKSQAYQPTRREGGAPLSRAEQLIEDAMQRLHSADEAEAQAEIAAQAATTSVATPASRTSDRTMDRATDNGVQSKYLEIDIERLRAMGMVVPDASKTPLAEEFRMIKRPLIKNALGQGAAPVKNGNLIMVTSAFPGEGKTFCAINLAMSIAMELDHTVLLVDADVARPSVPRQLGVKFGQGLMDVLLDPQNIDLADVMVRTNIDKLSILPSGRTHAHATELLASDAMSDLLNQLSTRYSDRIVIFDSPPLLLTTESRTLASKMGQIVMVVASETTTHAALQEALAAIDSCEVVGMVLNKAKYSQSGEYGYYGY